MVIRFFFFLFICGALFQHSNKLEDILRSRTVEVTSDLTRRSVTPCNLNIVAGRVVLLKMDVTHSVQDGATGKRITQLAQQRPT